MLRTICKGRRSSSLPAPTRALNSPTSGVDHHCSSLQLYANSQQYCCCYNVNIYR